MNWKRGLFRLWLIFSVVWFGSIAYLHLPNGLVTPVAVSTSFTETDAEFRFEGEQNLACYQANCITFNAPLVIPGKEGEWQNTTQATNELKFSIAKSNATARRLHHESRQWLYAAVIVPLLLLAAGATLGWALRGFKSSGAA